MAAAMQGTQTPGEVGSAFHRSSLKEAPLNEGFASLVSYTESKNLNQDQFYGLLGFLEIFNLKDLNPLLAVLRGHIEKNDLQQAQQDVKNLMLLKLKIPQCDLGGIIRSFCETMTAKIEYSQEDINTLFAMTQFLLSPLFENDQVIDNTKALLNAMQEEGDERNRNIHTALETLVSRFREGWGGYLGRHTPVVSRLWT